MTSRQTRTQGLVGDRRYAKAYGEVARASDRAAAIRALTDDEVVSALAEASRQQDPYLANVLAVEAANRMRRATLVASHLGEGVLAVGTDDRVSYANDAVERILGWSREDLLGHPIADTIGVDPASLHQVEEPAATRECQLRHVDGRLVDAICTVAPVRYEDERAGVVMAFRDITERKRQAAIRDLLLQAQADLGEAVLVLEDGKLVHANEALARLTGRPIEQLLDLPTLLELVAEEDREELVRVALASIHGAREPFRVKILLPDGRRVEVSALAKAVEAGGRRFLVAMLRRRSGSPSP